MSLTTVHVRCCVLFCRSRCNK